jgi:hypothetical protein
MQKDGSNSACYGHPDCPMTAGYYLGAGMWICWLHALYDPVAMKVIAATGQTMMALPKAESAALVVSHGCIVTEKKYDPSRIG